MKLTTELYFFLSLYVPLPLSALKLIISNAQDPFRKIDELSLQEIEDHLEAINKQPGVIIRNKKQKAQIIHKLIGENILNQIIERVEEWNAHGINIIAFHDNKYPKRLKVLKDAPKVIFYKGNCEFNFENAISIIGTRNPTDFGRRMAYKISESFAKLGFTIINGFAKGVDTEAIKGALKGGGNVIGVLGSGLFHPYPKENLELFDEIIDDEKGFFISEQLPENRISKSSLATRNRISSGLSLGNLLIEGGIESGTKWQLQYGKDQGKATIVLQPEDTHLEQAELPNHLIRSNLYDFIIKGLNDIKEIIPLLKGFNINKKIKGSQKTLQDY